MDAFAGKKEADGETIDRNRKYVLSKVRRTTQFHHFFRIALNTERKSIWIFLFPIFHFTFIPRRIIYSNCFLLDRIAQAILTQIEKKARKKACAINEIWLLYCVMHDLINANRKKLKIKTAISESLLKIVKMNFYATIRLCIFCVLYSSIC